MELPLNDDNPPSERLLCRTEASAYLLSRWGIRRSPRTLAKYAVTGGGPRFRKAGRTPLYSVRDLDTFAVGSLSKLVASTSELRTNDLKPMVGVRDG